MDLDPGMVNKITAFVSDNIFWIAVIVPFVIVIMVIRGRS